MVNEEEEGQLRDAGWREAGARSGVTQDHASTRDRAVTFRVRRHNRASRRDADPHLLPAPSLACYSPS